MIRHTFIDNLEEDIHNSTSSSIPILGKYLGKKVYSKPATRIP